MREIKFRAWDKERKEIRQVKLMDWSDWWVSTGSTWERENSLEYGERNSFNNEETDRHILMQYTGLKDKNGKEIYEGDIINWYVNGMTRTAPVYYDTDQASFWMGKEINGQGGLVLNDWMRGEYELLGNIHENPTLL